MAHITKWVKLAQFANNTIWVGVWKGSLGLGFEFGDRVWGLRVRSLGLGKFNTSMPFLPFALLSPVLFIPKVDN